MSATNSRLARLLTGATSPGVYRFSSRAAALGLMAQAQSAGWHPSYLNGEQITSKAEFLAICAQACHFPAYFGGNFDALEDSLRDLSWAPAARGYLVLYDEAWRFADAEPANFHTTLAILQTAVEFWQSMPTPMAVLLRGLPRRVSFGLGVPEL